MDQHRLDRQRVGDVAGVLAARAAEAVERIARDIIAARDGNLLDRLGHLGDRDGDEAVGDLLRAAPVADFARQRLEGFTHAYVVERLILRGAEYFGKIVGDQLARHDVGVGDGERAAAAIALRPGIGGRRIRADAKARAVEMQDRAAARRDGVDAHHRRAHAHARDLGLERALVGSVEMRDVGRGPPMSKPMTSPKPALRAVSAIATTPPAGPERIASLPANSSAAVRPPDDIMNITRAPVRLASSAFETRAM